MKYKWTRFKLTFHFFGFLDHKFGDASVCGEGEITAWQFIYKKRWGWKTAQGQADYIILREIKNKNREKLLFDEQEIFSVSLGK